MSDTNSNANGRGILSILRRTARPLQISGYHVGDIREDKPVAVLSGAHLIGDIFAPQISVAGLLYGSTVARETIIQAEGQIWGDVYTSRLEIHPGGKIQGWVSSLDEEGYQTLQNEGVIPRDKKIPTTGPFEVPHKESVEGSSLIPSSTQLDILRRLQAETAAALTARAELESTFDQRISEVAGEAASRATMLQEELTNSREQLAKLRQENTETITTLQNREKQIERHLHELEAARELLAERKTQLEELQIQYSQKTAEFDSLQQAKNDVDTRLLQAQQDIDKLEKRLQSLEGALQSSLQHSSEQEDALIRWQELAEVTEGRAKELEKELESLRLQLTESSRVTDMLRDQRQQAEQAWQETRSKLTDAEERLRRAEREVTELSAQNETLKGQRSEIETLWQTAKSELEVLRHQETRPLLSAEAEAQLGQLEYAKTKIGRMTEQIQTLTQERNEAEEVRQQYQERLLWNKASLETARLELNQTREQLETQTQQLNQIETQLTNYQKRVETHEATLKQQAQQLAGNQTKSQEDDLKLAEQRAKLAEQQMQLNQQDEVLKQQQTQLEEQSAQLTNQIAQVGQLQERLKRVQSQAIQWKGEAERLSEEVSNQEQILQAMQTQMEVVEQQSILEKEGAAKSVREMRSRIEAYEAELEQYMQQVNLQGRQLADMRATLVERDIQLNQIQATAQKQAKFIKQMKDVTTQHIQKLEARLAQSQQQVKDLTAVLQRRQRRQ